MQEMNLFSSSNYVAVEIGERLRKLLNMPNMEIEELEQLGKALCSCIDTEPRYILAILGSERLSVEYVKAIMEITKEFSYMSNVIALRDSQEYEICIRIFNNVTCNLVRDAHECYTIADFSAYSSTFIHLARIEKVNASGTLASVREILDKLGADRPIIFEAGYLYRSQYDEMYSSNLWLDLPEKLCKIYEDELYAINVNDTVGHNEESIAMLFISQEYDGSEILQHMGS